MHISKFMSVALIGVAFTIGAQKVCAEPEFLDTFTAKYHIQDSSKIGQATCGVCHVSDSDYRFNPYGKEIRDYLTEHNLKTVDNSVLAAVEPLDANGNGVSNLDEIKADKLPGAPAPGAKAAPAAPAAPTPPAPLIPKNAYHPAIVHFPIALLITGLLLDLAGLIWKKDSLLLAGWYNLVLAAVTSLGAIGSGLWAMQMMKLPYKGLIFTHLKLAIASAIIMWIMVALRVDRHENMKVPLRVIYYLLAIGGFLAISYAGHLGGKFVYGM